MTRRSVLAGQLDADVAVGEGFAGFDRPDLFRAQEGAVGIQAVGQPAHRPFHHPVDLDRLDVAAHHERDDVFEDAEVLVGLVAAGSAPCPCSPPTTTNASTGVEMKRTDSRVFRVMWYSRPRRRPLMEWAGLLAYQPL